MNRDYKEMIIVCIMIPMCIFTGYLCLFGWIASHEKSRYLKNHCNINTSTTDLFWNGDEIEVKKDDKVIGRAKIEKDDIGLYFTELLSTK